MKLIKLFTGLEGESEELERRINNWIRETEVNIVQITGNIAPQSTGHFDRGSGIPVAETTRIRPASDLFVIVLYEATD